MALTVRAELTSVKPVQKVTTAQLVCHRRLFARQDFTQELALASVLSALLVPTVKKVWRVHQHVCKGNTVTGAKVSAQRALLATSASLRQ
jgi:hypothetical protein